MKSLLKIERIFFVIIILCVLGIAIGNVLRLNAERALINCEVEVVDDKVFIYHDNKAYIHLIGDPQ